MRANLVLVIITMIIKQIELCGMCMKIQPCKYASWDLMCEGLAV